MAPRTQQRGWGRPSPVTTHLNITLSRFAGSVRAMFTKTEFCIKHHLTKRSPSSRTHPAVSAERPPLVTTRLRPAFTRANGIMQSLLCAQRNERRRWCCSLERDDRQEQQRPQPARRHCSQSGPSAKKTDARCANEFRWNVNDVLSIHALQ